MPTALDNGIMTIVSEPIDRQTKMTSELATHPAIREDGSLSTTLQAIILARKRQTSGHTMRVVPAVGTEA